MPHLLFVFGTLKQGFRNAHVNRGRRLGGNFATVAAYPLLIMGPRCLPWLLDRPGEGLPVVGQVFEVDGQALAAMDVLERVDDPLWYRRQPIRVRPHPPGDGAGAEAVDAFVYFGSEAGFEGQAVHAGPLAEYTLAHAAQFVIAMP